MQRFCHKAQIQRAQPSASGPEAPPQSPSKIITARFVGRRFGFPQTKQRRSFSVQKIFHEPFVVKQFLNAYQRGAQIIEITAACQRRGYKLKPNKIDR
jgi:hypothetical protein